MSISKINLASQNSFRGLWGVKTGISAGMQVELRKIDKYYPFEDDTLTTIRDEFELGLTNGIRDKRGELFPRFESLGEVLVQKRLPFKKEDYYAYKAKNGQRKDRIILTETDKAIERFLFFPGNGLSMYKNTYAGK